MIALRQLRYLTALARHRHFGRAAEHCAIGQPALSMQGRAREIGGYVCRWLQDEMPPAKTKGRC